MAAHFVVYPSYSVPTAAACSDSADLADKMKADRYPRGHVTRLLTGNCPICGKSVTRLSMAGGSIPPPERVS